MQLSLDSGIFRVAKTFKTLEWNQEENSSLRPRYHIYFILLAPEGVAFPEPLPTEQLDSQSLLRAPGATS